MGANGLHVCNAGNRKPKPLAAFVVLALAAGQAFNPEVKWEGLLCYIIVPDGKDKGEKRYLGKALEKYRFALGCGCKGRHCFYETLNNFCDRKDRLCRYCTLATGLWDAAAKDSIPECERTFMSMLQSIGLDRSVACQANLPYWHGRIDFYHMPSKTAMQLDGSSHFTWTHHRTAYHQLRMDLKCCRAAWKKGGRLLRVHSDHGMMQLVVVEAIKVPYNRYVMVTREYESVTVTWAGITETYTDWLLSVLPGAKCCIHTPSNCVLFY